MIPVSRRARASAAVLALAAHGALGWQLAPELSVEIEGGAGAAEARIGTAFADMAAGTLTAAPPQETAQPAAAPKARRAEAAPQPLRPAPAAEPVRPAPPELLAPAPSATAARPDAPAPALPADAPPAEAPRAAPAQAVAAPSPDASERAGAAETVAATDPEAAAPDRSLRPPLRPERRAEAAPPAPRGNADRSARAGAETGRRQAEAARSAAQEGRAGSVGNAAASNYPGEVLRRIARVPRPSVGLRGSAMVAFTVSGSGGLASVSVARSSGAARLDRAALDVVRAAAPFPAPPEGARRSFSIEIRSR